MSHPNDKYDATDSAFDKANGILRNKLGITDPAELERLENAALIAAYDSAALSYSETHAFTADDVRYLHRLFLGDIFAWAGTYREVDISSDDIRWCHAAHIPAEMERYGQRLGRLTPFLPSLPRDQVLSQLAELHAELVVIHPFRDGNGRMTRLLCNLLLMQAERAPIQFGAITMRRFAKHGPRSSTPASSLFWIGWFRKHSSRPLAFKFAKLLEAGIPRLGHTLHRRVEGGGAKDDAAAVFRAESFVEFHGNRGPITITLPYPPQRLGGHTIILP